MPYKQADKGRPKQVKGSDLLSTSGTIFRMLCAGVAFPGQEAVTHWSKASTEQQ